MIRLENLKPGAQIKGLDDQIVTLTGIEWRGPNAVELFWKTGSGYGDLLPRQPLRFLLADDPGAGKTIQTDLYLKELQMCGDLKRALAPVVF